MFKVRFGVYYSALSTFQHENDMSLAIITSRLQQTLDPVITRWAKPANLSRLTRLVPARVNHLVVEKMLNSVFAEQLEEGDFEFLQHRLLQIELIDARLFVGVSFSMHKLVCQHFSHQPTQSDATLSIDTANAIKLIQQEVDPDTLFFQRKLKINGDTELAHHAKNTIDTLNPDVLPSLLMSLITEYKQRVLDQR